MDQETRTRLLQSIDTGRMAILCGAGLSMAHPTCVPSANALAELCYAKYTTDIDPEFDAGIRNNLEAIAQHFHDQGTLITYFIQTLVPWQEFLGTPNSGHIALADFLLTKAAYAVLSSNYDSHIEDVARNYGEDFNVAINGDQANEVTERHSPLIKFHGCMYCCRDKTVWVEDQLGTDSDIRTRIENVTVWMSANLRVKDLLIIGYWSDWAYLNNIIETAFNSVTLNSMFLIDPAEPVILEEKAPELWQKAHSNGVYFKHIQQSGSDFLEELRIEFSRMYMTKLLRKGQNLLEAEIGHEVAEDLFIQPEMSSNDLYQWRRDAEGIPSVRAAKRRLPYENEILGFFHLLLRQSGADINQNGYLLNNKNIKVINGAGKHLSAMRNAFLEPPSISDIDYVVCVGAVDYGLPGTVIPRGEEGHIFDTVSLSNFITDSAARRELGI